MSVLPFSSILLWTEKGRTFLPLVRGSSFLIKYDVKGFHQNHVVTAAHCAVPPRFPALWPAFTNMQHIRERNVYHKLLLPERGAGAEAAKVALEVDLRPRPKVIQDRDVALLTMVKEARVLEAMQERGLEPLTPHEVDVRPIGEGESVVFHGFDIEEETGDPTGFSLRVRPVTIEGRTAAAVATSNGFGTVVLVEFDGEMPQGMCGGPVLRKSNNQCIGVIAGKVSADDPRTDFDLSKEKPVVDPRIVIGGIPRLRDNPSIRGGFTPIRDFHALMRRHEALQ